MPQVYVFKIQWACVTSISLHLANPLGFPLFEAIVDSYIKITKDGLITDDFYLALGVPCILHTQDIYQELPLLIFGTSFL